MCHYWIIWDEIGTSKIKYLPPYENRFLFDALLCKPLLSHPNTQEKLQNHSKFVSKCILDVHVAHGALSHDGYDWFLSNKLAEAACSLTSSVTFSAYMTSLYVSSPLCLPFKWIKVFLSPFIAGEKSKKIYISIYIKKKKKRILANQTWGHIFFSPVFDPLNLPWT